MTRHCYVHLWAKRKYLWRQLVRSTAYFRWLWQQHQITNRSKSTLKKKAADCLVFKMVVDALKKKIRAKTYQQRAEILMEFFGKEPKEDQILLIDCNCNVIGLANFMFKKAPSFREIWTCPAGCAPRIKSLSTISITDKELQKPLGKVILEHIYLEGVKCSNNRCKNVEKNGLHSTGNLFNYCLNIYFIKWNLQNIKIIPRSYSYVSLWKKFMVY